MAQPNVRWIETAKNVCCALSLISISVCSMTTQAAEYESTDEITLQTNAYNTHYRHDPDHLRYSPLIGAELRKQSGWLYGGALFRNSFGQFSQTLYFGHLWYVGDSGFYGKVVGGLIHGYVGAYKNKVPLNCGGFSPGVIPALGYRVGALRVEAQFFGTSGLMVTAGFAFR